MKTFTALLTAGATLFATELAIQLGPAGNTRANDDPPPIDVSAAAREPVPPAPIDVPIEVPLPSEPSRTGEGPPPEPTPAPDPDTPEDRPPDIDALVGAVGDVELDLAIDPTLRRDPIAIWLAGSGAGLVVLQRSLRDGCERVRSVHLPTKDGLPSRTPTTNEGFEAFLKAHGPSRSVWIELGPSPFDQLTPELRRGLHLVLGKEDSRRVRCAAQACGGSAHLRLTLAPDPNGSPVLSIAPPTQGAE